MWAADMSWPTLPPKDLMIIAPDFVFLQLPRSGSTFVGNRILKAIPDAFAYEETIAKRRRGAHNFYTDIPEEHAHLPRYGVKRGILNWWASCYTLIRGHGSNRRMARESFEAYYNDVNRWTAETLEIDSAPDFGFNREYRKAMFGDGQTTIFSLVDLSEKLGKLLAPYSADYDPTPIDGGSLRLGKHWKHFIPPELADKIKEDEKE